MTKNVLFLLTEQFSNLPDLSKFDKNCQEFSNGEIISTLQINDINEEEIEPFSPKEFDEFLQSFPINLINEELIDLDFTNCLIDSSTITNDDLFVQMLLDNDYSSSTITNSTLFYSSLPKITTVDEFDAFLRDFTRNLLPTPIG